MVKEYVQISIRILYMNKSIVNDNYCNDDISKSSSNDYFVIIFVARSGQYADNSLTTNSEHNVYRDFSAA